MHATQQEMCQVRTSCPQNYIQGLKIILKNLGIMSG
jgi:hypothetical protein